MNLKSPKFIIYGAIIAALLTLGGYALFRNGRNGVETKVVHRGDFVQEVSVSGKVIAAENLDLSFDQSGRIAAVGVKAGDRVIKGQILASQEAAELNAQLAEMQAGIDVQKARLAQLLAGSSPEDIAVAEIAVQNAQTAAANKESSLEGARQKMADTLKDVYTKSDDALRIKSDQMFSNPRSSDPQLNFIGSAYESEIEWERFLLESTLNSWATASKGISPASDFETAVPIAKKNLDQVRNFLDKLATAVGGLTASSNLSQAVLDKWKTDVASARANINTAFADLTSAQAEIDSEESGLKTARGNLQKAEQELTLKKSGPRETDIALYEAQIRQAEAGAQNILSRFAKRQIRSPINGIVTAVNAKTGAILAANQTAVSLIDSKTLQIESFVPELNIPLIKVGNPAAVTLDAYEAQNPFLAEVVLVDPAETVRDGVSTYRIKLQFLKADKRLKSGMTANVVITTERKSGVITVPQGIVKIRDGKKFLRVKNKEKEVEREVETGGVSSLGDIEITSGLKEGEIVILKKD